VNRANVMGATKRLGELIIFCRPASFMRCVSVRFENALGSNGSVVPIFQKQIRDHQQLTIRDPAIVRFFVTTREAVSLVSPCFAIGNHGDTLLLDRGEPGRILDLAKTLIRLSGKSEREVGIRFTGLRDGKKLCEELSYPAEEIHATPFPKIRQIRGTPHRGDDLTRHLGQLRSVMSVQGAAAIRIQMKEIVPEYFDGHDDRQEDAGLRAGPDARANPQFFESNADLSNSARDPAPHPSSAPSNEPGNE
jgi:FlaA1/EpsC-like NDP-sugar epimerase